jgi:hypothetical protein
MSLVAGVAVLVSAGELVALRRDPLLRALTGGRAVEAERGVLAPLLRDGPVAGALLLQLAAGVALLAGGAAAPWGAAVAAATALLAAMRHRGRVNGGSDAMLFTVLVALAVAPLGGARLREGAVLFVAAQATLSYVRAGLAKAREGEWWRGEAMPAFLALPAYGVPAALSRPRGALRLAGLAVIVAECLAPLAWTGPRAAAVVVAVAAAFHLAVAYVFGLNRFVLAWGAALPALLYAGQRAS